MKISIIIPVLDEISLIEDCLRSLSPLSSSGFEFIVVDGGSQDGTVGIADKIVDRVVISPPGRGQQLNAGARAAQGDWLLFLHVDTILPIDVIEILKKQITQYDYWGYFSVRLSGEGTIFRIIEYMMGVRSYYTQVATGDQALFVRRDIFRMIGGFPNQALMEDIAISKKLRRLAVPKFIRSPVITSSKRWEQFGVWRIILKMWYCRALYFLGVSPEYISKIYLGKSFSC